RLSAREEPGQALNTTTFQQGEERPPTADQFVYIVRNYDREKIAGLCRQFDLDSPDHPILAGGDFTGLGYQMLQGGQTDKALEIFRMGTAAFPNSANAWDSYGEAYIAAGDNASALKYYRRALEILPQDSTINPALRDAIANNVPAVIERLQAALSEQSEGN
ncbi:MAG: tetratricopeptide repeat protein, partial [candidate division Zixibacteria bacterium]|nr:tetratricopeptide repeat protein [candidate division Zixibacteria bacterium]